MTQPESETNPPRLTVAIPLHHGKQWEQIVVENIRRIPEDTRIILSDEVSSDDAAANIARQFENDPRIKVRMKNGAAGWREHYNALIRENETELFCILPQDDTIETGYYEKLIAALDQNPHVGLAFGSMVATGDSLLHGKISAPRGKIPSPPFKLGKTTPWIEAILLESYGHIGVSIRGVMRRETLRLIAQTPDDRFADLSWIFGIALKTYMLEVPDAIYTKRYYSHSTHSRWKILSAQEHKNILDSEIRNVLGDQDIVDHALAFLDRTYIHHQLSRCQRICGYTSRLISKYFGRH